jgi:hypothetical protein
MDIRNIVSYMSNGETLYIIGTFMFSYMVVPVRITGIISEPNSAPRAEVINSLTGKIESVNIDDLFENEDVASETCKKLQKVNGHIVITQQEYDALKEKICNLEREISYLHFFEKNILSRCTEDAYEDIKHGVFGTLKVCNNKDYKKGLGD